MDDQISQELLKRSIAQSDHANLINIGVNTHDEIDTALTRLVDTSGENTGDQVLSGYAATNGDDAEDFAAQTLITSDIGATAAQEWRLGTVKGGAALVVLTTSYVEVEINGVIVKLAQIT